MSKYAYFDPAQGGRVLAWLDTDEFAHVLPPAELLHECSEAEWDSRDAGERAVQAGAVVAYVPPAPDLAAAVAAVVATINNWRDEQEQALIVFDHGGRQWDGGLVVRQRLQPVIALAALPEGFYWTAADNVDVPMTLAELGDLNAAHEAAIVARGWQIHARQRAMKNEVAALETVEAVRAYVVGWPD